MKGIRDAGVFAVIIGSEATTSDIHRRLLRKLNKSCSSCLVLVLVIYSQYCRKDKS